LHEEHDMLNVCQRAGNGGGGEEGIHDRERGRNPEASHEHKVSRVRDGTLVLVAMMLNA
jgi:hypothetical protein